ncbi:hypothetical protein AAHE18_15G099000 [Arachis hypogaea]
MLELVTVIPLSSAISNLIPAFTFILAIICRMEKIDVKTRTTQAKIVGSIISIGGAFIVTFTYGNIDFDPNSLQNILPKAVLSLEWTISEGK